MRQTNVLFTSAGRRVSLVRHFRQALDELGDGGRLITADMLNTAPAHQVSDCRKTVPGCSDPAYVSSLLEICANEHVQLLIPLIDTELPVLSQNLARFREAGTHAAVCAPETIAISRDKQKTHEFFEREGFPTPRLFHQSEAGELKSADLPVFVKPLGGSSSVGAQKVASLEMLAHARANHSDLIVMEFVEGTEFTIDVYVDFRSKPQVAVPRRRIETRAGEVSKSVTVRDESLIDAALDIAGRLPGAQGCITIQCFKRADGSLSFIEINPRFGGGYPLSFHAGARFPFFLIQEAHGETPDFEAAKNWREDLYMLRYDDELIVAGNEL